MLKALIFDLDGTLADTEETHRQAFNAAFLEHGLAWDWRRRDYAELLRTSGGKERIEVYIESLRLEPQEKVRLKRMVQLIHGSKTRIYGELIADGRAPRNRRSSLMFMSFLLVLLAGVGVGFLAERALHGPRGHGAAPTLWLPAGLNP